MEEHPKAPESPESNAEHFEGEHEKATSHERTEFPAPLRAESFVFEFLPLRRSRTKSAIFKKTKPGLRHVTSGVTLTGEESLDLICIMIPEQVQQELKIIVGQDLTIDNPWKTIAKKDFMEFLPVIKLTHPKIKRMLEAFPFKEMVIGYDASAEKEGEYYLTATEYGRNQLLKQLKQMDQDLKDKVARYMKRPTGKWHSLGSEEEILTQDLFISRPLIRFEWVGEIEPRLKEVAFEAGDPVNMKGAYTRILSKTKDISLVERVVLHTGAQATPSFVETSVQTEPEISINACTQFSPESLIPEQITISPEDKIKIDRLFATYSPKLFEAIGYNELFDLYKDDYTELYEKGEPLHISIFKNYRHYDSLTDLSMYEGLLITAMCWHPTLTGILAAAYGLNYPSKKVKLDADAEKDREKSNEPVVSSMRDWSDTELKKWTAQVKHIEKLLHSKEYNETEWDAGEATLDAIQQAKILRNFQVKLQKTWDFEKVDALDTSVEYDMFYVPYGTEIDIDRPLLRSIIQYGSDVVNQMMKIKEEKRLYSDMKSSTYDSGTFYEGESHPEGDKVSDLKEETETEDLSKVGISTHDSLSLSSSQSLLSKETPSAITTVNEAGLEEESKIEIQVEEEEKVKLPPSIRISDKYKHPGKVSDESLLEVLAKRKDKAPEFTIFAILPVKIKPKVLQDDEEKVDEPEEVITTEGSIKTGKTLSVYEDTSQITEKVKLSQLSQKEIKEAMKAPMRGVQKTKGDNYPVSSPLEKSDSLTMSFSISESDSQQESEEKDFEDIWGKEDFWYYGPQLREVALTLYRLHKETAVEIEGPMPTGKRLKIPKPRLPQLPFAIAESYKDKKKSAEIEGSLKPPSKVSMRSQVGGNLLEPSASVIESRILLDHRPSEKRSMEGSLHLKSEVQMSRGMRQSKVQPSTVTPALLEGLPDIEEPKLHILNEITEEVNEEEYLLKAISPEYCYNYPVLIWALSDTIVPRLRLCSPYEVVTLSFCPHNGNLIVGGTIGGQIVLWDITGKIESFAPVKTTQADSAASFVESVHIIESMLCWRRSRKSFKQLPPTAITSKADSHMGRIVDLTWVHPGKMFNKHGELEPIEEGEPLSMQFITTSEDNVIKVWDLTTKPKPKPQLRYPDKAFNRHERIKKGKDIFELPSEFADLHRTWAPFYEIQMKPEDVFFFSNFSFAHETHIYVPNFVPLKGHAAQIEDIVPYKLVVNRNAYEEVPKGGFFGTLKGDIGYVSWEGRAIGGSTEGVEIQNFPPYHDGPITCISRHELFPHILLSTGGHVFAIWNLNYPDSPIKWKRYRDVELTCCGWACYPSMFRVARSDGIMEVWDLTFQSHKPLPLQASAGKTITGMMNTRLPSPKLLIVLADITGSMRIFTFENADLAEHSMFAEMENMVNSQPDRLRKLKEWGNKWCEEHMNRKQRANIKGYNQAVEVFLEQETGDSGTFVKKDTKPDVSACDRYKEQVYQWYLRRRGDQCVWLDEVERKWYLQEEAYMKQRVLENKKWDEKKMEQVMKPLDVKEKREQARKQRVQEMLDQADDIFKAAVADILIKKDIDRKASRISVRVTEEKGFDAQSAIEETQLLFGFHYEKFEKEKMEEVKKYQIKDKKMLDIIGKYRQVRNIFNDARRFRDPKLRWLRTSLKQLVEKNGFELVEWESRIQRLMKWEKYERRFQDIETLKSMYGPNYNPLWDQQRRIQSFEKRMAACGIMMDYKVPKRKKPKGGLRLNSIIKGTEISLIEKSSVETTSVFTKTTSEVTVVEEAIPVEEEVYEESIRELDILSDQRPSRTSEEGSMTRLPEIPKKVKFYSTDELDLGGGVLPLPDIIPHEEASAELLEPAKDPLQKWTSEEVRFSSDHFLNTLLAEDRESSESSLEDEFEPDIVTMEAHRDVDEIVDKISSMYAMLKPNVNIEVDLHKIKWEPTEEYLVSDEEVEHKTEDESEAVDEDEVQPSMLKPTAIPDTLEEEMEPEQSIDQIDEDIE